MEERGVLYTRRYQSVLNVVYTTFHVRWIKVSVPSKSCYSYTHFGPVMIQHNIFLKCQGDLIVSSAGVYAADLFICG